MSKIKELIMTNNEHTYSISHFEGVVSDALSKSIIDQVKTFLAPDKEEMDEFNKFCVNLQNLLDGYILDCEFNGYTFKIEEVSQTEYTPTAEEELLNAVDKVATLNEDEKVLLLDIVHLLANNEYKPYAFNELYHTTRKYI